MAVPEQQIAVNSVMADFWFSQLTNGRRALCALASIDPKVAEQDWHRISVPNRMSLVRAIRVMADVCIEGSMALEAARLEIEYKRARH